MTGSRRTRRVAAYALLASALASTIVPLLPAAEQLPVWKHHLVHGLVLALASAAGLLFADAYPAAVTMPRGPSFGWLLVTVLAPVISMVLMWPTTYAWLERHPLAHGLEHLCFVALGFLASYGGERYVPGVGWVSGTVIALTAVVAAAGFGVSLQQ